MDDRERKGREIAFRMRLVLKDDCWLVPSQSSNRKYRVVIDDESTCTCEDYKTRRQRCKHIWAVVYFLEWEVGDEGWPDEVELCETKRKKPTYPQNWPPYNAAQTNEQDKFLILLHELCRGLKPWQPHPNGGRPRIPIADSIFAAVYKVYSTFSGRRFMSQLRAAKRMGYISQVPHYNSIFTVLSLPDVSEILTSLIQAASVPLKNLETTSIPDSTAFSTSRFRRWQDVRDKNVQKKRDWIKAHVTCGPKTHIIMSVQVSDADAHDSPFLPHLINEATKNFVITEVLADLGYSSADNLLAVIQAGATPYIPFKVNATGGKGGIWEVKFNEFRDDPEAFFEHYHQRSNVESVFSSVKRKFSEVVRSKNETAMRNEVLCKLLCHNLCCLIQTHYELGVQPEFRQEKAFA